MMTQKSWQFTDWLNYAVNVEAQEIVRENAQQEANGKDAKEKEYGREIPSGRQFSAPVRSWCSSLWCQL